MLSFRIESGAAARSARHPPQADAGDVVGLVAGEEHRGVGDVPAVPMRPSATRRDGPAPTPPASAYWP